MSKFIVCLAAFLAPLTTLGHHSSAGFNFNAVEELEGEILAVSWRNPHVELRLRVGSGDGAGEIWELEAQDVNSLGRRGLGADSIHVGDSVRVAGNPAANGDRDLYVTNVLLPSGTEIRTRGDTYPRWSTEHIGFERPVIEELRASADEAQGIFRVWMAEESRGFGADLPLTSAARNARAAWDPADNLTMQCVAGGMPGVMTRTPAPHPVDFTEHEGSIVVRMEVFDIVRTVHMDPDADAAEQPATPLGYSVGRWEGSTLVVSTTRVSWPYFNSIGSIPQSDAVEITERFTLSEDENQLEYVLTVADPATFTETVSARWVLGWRPDLVVEPFECVLDG